MADLKVLFEAAKANYTLTVKDALAVRKEVASANEEALNKDLL